MIDRKKLALINIAKKALDMHEDDYRALLKRAAGVESAKDLDANTFAAVMVELGKLGFESTAAQERRKAPLRAGGHATYAQRSYIQRLWQEYKGTEDQEGLRRWLQHKFKVSHLRFLDTETAPKVIFALKNFKQRPTK